MNGNASFSQYIYSHSRQHSGKGIGLLKQVAGLTPVSGKECPYYSFCICYFLMCKQPCEYL